MATPRDPVLSTATDALPPDGHFLHKAMGGTIPDYPLEVAPLPPCATTAAAAASLHRDGYVVFPHVLSPTDIAALRTYMDTHGGDEAQYDVPKWCFNKHLAARFHQEPDLLPLVDREPVVAAAQAVLGPDIRCIGGSLWVTGPGRVMGLHLDYQPIQLPEAMLADPQVILPVFIATAHYYLDDLTLEYGPTTLIPGSHRAGRPPHDETTWNGRRAQAAVIPAGSCLLFRSDLWHGGAMNHGPHRRYLIQVHYANGYIDSKIPSLRHVESWSAASQAALNERQRELFGGGTRRTQGSYNAPEHQVFRQIAS